jgi:hypothetical protein
MKTKCAVRGCQNRFMKKRGNHVYCRKCATKQQYLRSFEWEQRRKKKDPEGVRKYHRERQRSWNLRIKTEVLTHYGKGGKLLCCWKNCSICDLDMLSLDHVENNGKNDREKGYLGGSVVYKKLRKFNFPAGFQTLCFNHQFKKELLRRRRLYF